MRLAAASCSYRPPLAQPVSTPPTAPSPTPQRAAEPARASSTSRPSCFASSKPSRRPRSPSGAKSSVILTIDIDETGKVVKVDVAHSGGDEFDDAAAQAARQFVFAPGEAGGKPVPVASPTNTSSSSSRRRRRRRRRPSAPPAPPTVPVDGRVLRAGDRQPLGGINVIVDDTDVATTTNAAGRFHLDAPVGAHTLHVVGPEIAKSDFKVTLTAGKSLTTTWYVLGRERYISTVRGQRAVVETVEQTLSGDELRHIAGTQGDTLKAVQNLPGVARAPFSGGLLVVWGSAPQRHAHLRRRRLHPDAVPLRRRCARR